MTAYTTNDAWCSVQDARDQNVLLTSAVMADDKINEFIDDATDLIKNKIRTRYDLTKFILPLPADMKQIRKLTARLACYKAVATRPDMVANPEITAFLWKEAFKELDDISYGRAALPPAYLLSELSFMQPGTIRGALTPSMRSTTSTNSTNSTTTDLED